MRIVAVTAIALIVAFFSGRAGADDQTDAAAEPAAEGCTAAAGACDQSCAEAFALCTIQPAGTDEWACINDADTCKADCEAALTACKA